MDDQTQRGNRDHWIESLQNDISAELNPEAQQTLGEAEENIMSLIEQYITLIWKELDGDEPEPSGSRYEPPDDMTWRF